MFENSRFRSSLLALSLILALVAAPSLGYCKGATASKSERRVINSALKRELGRQTPDHVKVSSFAVTSLDVRSNWALAKVKPTRNQRQDLDSVMVLLHKVGGKWKCVTLGSNLHGAGQQYKVPRSLWSRWGLEE